MSAVNKSELFVRELQVEDIPLIVKYWLESESEFLESMGVDLKKLPSAENLTNALLHQLSLPFEVKKAFCIIWFMNGKAIGHSNLNPVTYGNGAMMHLHIWKEEYRKMGLGTAFLKLTVPIYFECFKLKELCCEPYALNEAPNRTLARLGFIFDKEYDTIPGSINFEQPVKRWVLSLNEFNKRFPCEDPSN